MADKDDLALIFPKKKINRGKYLNKKHISDTPLIAAETAAFELGRTNLIDAKKDWPDYTYEELLGFIFEKDSSFGEDKKEFEIIPPQIARIGRRKTAFINYAEICKLLKRQPKHVLQFLLAELGTTGSIGSNQCLIVKGHFQQKHFERVILKYIKEYVTCHTCKSSDTDLIKDTRLYFLQCKTCGSRCSVTAFKTGLTEIFGSSVD
uniref:Translation initiation factor IF2/IF5 domain-containing protein n=1 Tax=Panagrolaimus sp. ES5 TaxID=591445 RepID=A0AC34G9T0_9BILA